jgi:hypothetical protein
MPNGRCRIHGGLCTGPKSPEGKARVVAAMVPGRLAWIARLRAEGRKLPSGRKAGPEWITEAMEERAQAEARKLTGGWSPPFEVQDTRLVWYLLRSEQGKPWRGVPPHELTKRAKALLWQRAKGPPRFVEGVIAMMGQEIEERRERERVRLASGLATVVHPGSWDTRESLSWLRAELLQ